MELMTGHWHPLWDWSRLSERDRQGAWCELTDWVQHTLIGRYGLGAYISPAWQRDGRLVRTLIRFHEWEAQVTATADRLRWEATLRRVAPTWELPQAATA